LLLGSDVDGAEIEEIGVGVIAVDFEDFGDESAARPSFDVDDDIERVADVCFNRVGAIYNVHPSTIFSFFGCNVSDFGRDQAMFAPAKTQLASHASDTEDTIVVPMKSRRRLRLDRTNLLARLGKIWGEVPIRLIQHLDLRNGVYGFVGLSDRTMFPIIRPGSIVQIDQNQHKIAQTKWEDEDDRPIYFVELRGEFICSWCEMRDGYLLAVPHPKSKCQVRRFAYPREADIVGRVIGVTNRLVEGE
jgi:hypothetical protein